MHAFRGLLRRHDGGLTAPQVAKRRHDGGPPAPQDDLPSPSKRRRVHRKERGMNLREEFSRMAVSSGPDVPGTSRQSPMSRHPSSVGNSNPFNAALAFPSAGNTSGSATPSSLYSSSPPSLSAPSSSTPLSSRPATPDRDFKYDHIMSEPYMMESYTPSVEVTDAHFTEEAEARDRVLAECQSTIAAIQAERDFAVASVQSERDSTVASVQSERDSTVASLQAERDSTVASVQAECHSIIVSVRAECDSVVASLQAELETARQDAARAARLQQEVEERASLLHTEVAELKMARQEEAARAMVLQAEVEGLKMARQADADRAFKAEQEHLARQASLRQSLDHNLRLVEASRAEVLNQQALAEQHLLHLPSAYEHKGVVSGLRQRIEHLEAELATATSPPCAPACDCAHNEKKMSASDEFIVISLGASRRHFLNLEVASQSITELLAGFPREVDVVRALIEHNDTMRHEAWMAGSEHDRLLCQLDSSHVPLPMSALPPPSQSHVDFMESLAAPPPGWTYVSTDFLSSRSGNSASAREARKNCYVACGACWRVEQKIVMKAFDRMDQHLLHMHDGEVDIRNTQPENYLVRR